MLGIDILCVGKLKEKFFLQAAEEYKKRLSSYCKLSVVELSETPCATPSEIKRALALEADRIEAKIPKSAYLICMCIEGKMLSSEELSKTVGELKCRGVSNVCIIIGGSNGIDEKIKKKADLCLSMSRMTFPHHLARIMLLEQIYRAFKIEEGSGYHK